MAALAVACAVGLIVDDRVLVGAPIWWKPFKFAVSFAVYGLTLAWMLSRQTTASRTARWAAHAVVVSGLTEMVIIAAQALRGRRSHFNVETPLDQLLFSIMGITIAVLWVATFVIAVILWRARLGDRATDWAIRLGLLIALAGLLLGGLMVGPTAEQQAAGDLGTVVGAHSVGVPDGGPAMPLTGWSATGGDLRIPHFLGMHALQAIPLFLYALEALAGRFTRLRDESVRLRLVQVAAGCVAALVALVTWQALRGEPLLQPDAATLGALGVLALATAAGTYTAVRRRPATTGDNALPLPLDKELT
ncbi:hypothetical protein [Streptomyces sp. NPDC017993]|uniref:hypothetical protein n=1 Tax=Streptomyces sp. NPDC017993 TaxID=3365027 RepID=UPI0037BA3022